MSNLISGSELSFLQGLVAGTFDHSCQIQNKTTIADGYGQATESWNTIVTVMVGVDLPKSSLLAAYAERIGSLATWLVKFPLGMSVTIQEQQHLIITDSQGNAQIMVVQALVDPRSYPLYLPALASEVR